MSDFPKFHVSLKEVESPHPLETKPRYDILVNGVKRDFIYFNTRGYRGAIPMLGGACLDPGTGGIRRFRNAVREVNAHAKEFLAAARLDPAVVSNVQETTNRDYVLATLQHKETGETLDSVQVRRDSWEYARILFADEPVSAYFLEKSEQITVEPVKPWIGGLRPEDKVIGRMDTNSMNFVMLVTGQPPENKRGLLSISPSEMEANANGVAFITSRAWRELSARSGRGLIDVSDLPLIDGGTLAVEAQPNPMIFDEFKWVDPWLETLRNTEPDIAPGF